MRWIWVLIAMLAFAAVFQVKATWMVVCLLGVGVLALVMAFFAFAAARLGAVTEAQSSRELDLLIQARGVVPPKPAGPAPLQVPPAPHNRAERNGQ